MAMETKVHKMPTKMFSRKGHLSFDNPGQDLSSHDLDKPSSSKDSLKKYIKIKNEIMTGEIMLKMTENNTRSKTNMGIVAPHVNTAGPECPKCGQVCKDYSNLKNHVLSHYYKMFYMVLPQCKPFPCPICGHCNRDRITMVRHYAFTHKKIFEMTDVTVQDLHGSVTKIMISCARGASTSAKGAVVASSSKKQNISPMMDDSSDDDEDVKKMKAQLSSFSNKNEDIKVKCRPDSEKNTMKTFSKETNDSDSENDTKKKFCKEKNRSDSENDTKKKFCKEKNRSDSENYTKKKFCKEKNTKKRFWQKGKPMLNEGTVLCPKCSETLRNSNIEEHLKEVHNNLGTSLKCEICKRRVFSSDIPMHMPRCSLVIIFKGVMSKPPKSM